MNHSTRAITAICIAVCAFAIVVLSTAGITYQIVGQRNTDSLNVEPIDSGYDTRYARLDEVYTRLVRQYYTEVDSEALILGAINGMMASLDDPYTFYYTPEKMSEAAEAHDGNYVGIGIQVTYISSGKIYITRVFRDGSGYEAGLRAGDIILRANGHELSARNSVELSQAVSYVKGEAGSFSDITILRDGKEIELSIECRAVVNTRTEYKMLDDGVGYIELIEFYGDAVEAMENALAFMKENNAKALILDLRGNTGGQLDICTAISDMFLPEGVIVYTEDREGEREYYYSDSEYYDIPLAVLVNELTASSSEILTAAVQDYQRGVVIGCNTFGKGIVQTWYKFPADGAGMQLTTSAYYTPNGRSIHKTGIAPDIYVEADAVTDETIKQGMTLLNDSALRTAWELLTGKTYEAQ